MVSLRTRLNCSFTNATRSPFSSTARMLSIGLMPIGVLLGGVLLEAIGGSATLLLIGAGVIALTALFALSATQRGAVAGTAHPQGAAGTV